MSLQRGPLEEPAGEWFVNRRTELDLFWEWGRGIPHPGRRSYALVGLRRTGKTAILHKTFNRLFHEQDKVVPVYISFARYVHRTEPINAYEFAEEYFTGVVRSYLAFRHNRPDLLQHQADYDELHSVAREVKDELAQTWFERYEGAKSVTAHNLMQWVINFPKGYAWTHEIPMAIIVDEFQVLTQVYNPESDSVRHLTDSFQHASETRYAPMLVSGSSISMLVGDALGGMLSGRFQSLRLGPLSQEFAVDLVLRLGQATGVSVTEELALAIFNATQGYPYSIERIMLTRSPDVETLPDLNKFNDIIFFELTNELGALREHYEDEYGKYVRQLNGDNVTRKILFWLTNFPGEHLNPNKISDALTLDILQVQDSLEKLYKIDIIQRASISTFRGPTDPLLLSFLRFEHYLDIDDLVPQDAEAKLRHELNAKQGEMNRQTGHFTEVIVAGVIRNFTGQEVDGKPYFNVAKTAVLPRMNSILRREGVVKQGKVHEVDVVGEYKLSNQPDGRNGFGAWLVSVRYRQEKMGEKDVQIFIEQANALQSEKQYGEVILWFFSKAGFTDGAKAKLMDEGIYFSDLAQFNALAEQFGLLPLTM